MTSVENETSGGHGIAEVTLGRALETTVEELAGTIHAHPTLAETVMEAALATLGRPIHI
jgi:dihydrolipoamide dehydrogenase